MKKAINFLSLLIFIGIFIIAGYFFSEPIKKSFLQLQARYMPCQKPIAYTIGSFDKRFGITEGDFVAAVNKAVQSWEEPASKKLFEQTSNGILKVNLIYDYRQEATQKLSQLGIELDDNKTTYDALKSKYNVTYESYLQKKAQLDKLASQFSEDKKVYETNINYWNNKGGAPKLEYERLNRKKIELNNKVNEINQLEGEVNSLVISINALANILNRLVYVLNLGVSQYNSIGTERGEEFEEGVYIGSLGGGEINIYEFADKKQLLRVLMHEFGHALGINHLENSNAIMYKLNQSQNEKLTTDDISALKNRCGIE